MNPYQLSLTGLRTAAGILARGLHDLACLAYASVSRR